MIKYSQRGLVVNGKLPFLFYLQYLLISVAFYCQWSLILAYIAFFNSESLDENMLKTFRFRGGGEVNCFFRVKYFATLTCIFSMLFLFMGLDILYSKIKSKKHYRQNVFTFNLTLFWGLSHCLLFIVSSMTICKGDIYIFSVMRVLIILSSS